MFAFNHLIIACLIALTLARPPKLSASRSQRRPSRLNRPKNNPSGLVTLYEYRSPTPPPYCPPTSQQQVEQPPIPVPDLFHVNSDLDEYLNMLQSAGPVPQPIGAYAVYKHDDEPSSSHHHRQGQDQAHNESPQQQHHHAGPSNSDMELSWGTTPQHVQQVASDYHHDEEVHWPSDQTGLESSAYHEGGISDRHLLQLQLEKLWIERSFSELSPIHLADELAAFELNHKMQPSVRKIIKKKVLSSFNNGDENGWTIIEDRIQRLVEITEYYKNQYTMMFPGGDVKPIFFLHGAILQLDDNPQSVPYQAPEQYQHMVQNNESLRLMALQAESDFDHFLIQKSFRFRKISTQQLCKQISLFTLSSEQLQFYEGNPGNFYRALLMQLQLSRPVTISLQDYLEQLADYYDRLE